MEEIEYLEEYEDLILPMSFAVDDDKRNERKSIDSLEMLYKDLIEETSIHQSNVDTSPFSTNQQMISPEKTILSSTVDIGLTQSFSNYSTTTTSPTYVNTPNTGTLNSYQAQTSNIQFLNRLTNKTFSTYSSLQKPDKLKSVATVKPTLQRVNNPPKQYVQRESPSLKASISGQSAIQSQHNFSRPTSTKTAFGLKNSANVSKTKSSLKPNKLSTSGVDPLAGLDDDTFFDLDDDRNGLADGFDFESDLDNSLIAGLSDMDSDSVDLSDGFIDDNFDLESDFSSEGSDLKKLLKRKRPQLNSQDSSERQTNISSLDMKRDVSNSVKKKQSPNKYGSDRQQKNKKSIIAELKRTQPLLEKEMFPKASSSVGKEASISASTTKVNEAINKGNNILHQLSNTVNESHQQIPNTLNRTPTVPLYNKGVEKTENGFKQFLGISASSSEKSNLQKDDDRNHGIVDPFKGFDESSTLNSNNDDVVKNNLVEQILLKSPQTSTVKSNQKELPLEKASPIKFGSFYLRSIKPPINKTFLIKTAPNALQQPVVSKVLNVLQTVKAPEETPQESTLEYLAKAVNSVLPPPDAITNREKRKSVPKLPDAKNQNSNELKGLSQSKQQKSQVTVTAPGPNKDITTAKIHDLIGKQKAQTQPRQQKIGNELTESMVDKESTTPGTQAAKRKDLIEKSKVHTQITLSILEKDSSISNVEVPKEVSDKPKGHIQLEQKFNVEEKAGLKFEKRNTNTKSEEVKDRDINEKLKVQIQPKMRKSLGERTTATLQKSSTPNIQQAKKQEVTEKVKEQSQMVKRRKSSVGRNRNKSVDRISEKKHPTIESKEIDEKQIKTTSKCVEETRLEPTFNGNASAQSSQQTNKALSTSTTTLPSQSDKKIPHQQNDETQFQQSIPESTQQDLLPSKRRKSVVTRKLSEASSKLKTTHKSKQIPEQPLEQTATTIAEQKSSQVEDQKLVTSQLLQKDTMQIDNIRKIAVSRMKSGKTSLKKSKPRSPKKAGLLEQNKVVPRGFNIRLNRNTVDHFMKLLKDQANSSPQLMKKDSELKIIKSPLRRMPKLKRFDSPLPIGRQRKSFQKKVRTSLPLSNSELKEVLNDTQTAANATLVTSLTQNELQFKNNVTLEVNTSPILKKRKKKSLQSNQAAKLPRRDITSSMDSINLLNKDCTNDRVPSKEQCSTDEANITPALPVIDTETSSASVPTEATNSAVPTETSISVDPKNIISDQISPTIPTNANISTFPTDATSPAASTDAISLASQLSHNESVQTSAVETSMLVNPPKRRKPGRPISKGTLMRLKFARRRELIKASTLQRLTETNVAVDQTPEEVPTPDPVPLQRPVESANECLRNENIETASPESSQPPDGPRLSLENLVQPKTEIGDSVDSNYSQMPGSATAMFDGAPTLYSFARPIDAHRRNSELLLDTCQSITNSHNAEQNGTTESVTVFDLPSYIVMRTRIVTRSDLQNNKSAIPPQVKETINKLAENVHVAPVIKVEEPDFKDICLEINALLGRNANYLKFASSSERQARMNRILSDSSLSVQEAQSALKFLQSYLSARTKDAAVSNTKGQQFIPIYDSQKKVIGYRQRRVHPKKSSLQAQRTVQSSRLLNKNSNRSAATTSSMNCSTSTASNEVLSVEVSQFATKKEPLSTDAGDEELIVPDAPPADKPIKCETES